MSSRRAPINFIMINETVETINQRLIDYYSTAWNGLPIFRIVWSEDQFETRATKYTDAGLELIYPIYKELPKYRQWIHNKYVLERYVVVPEVNAQQVTEKLSYEPIHVFEDGAGNALPPKWEAANFVIRTLLAAQGKKSMRSYVEDLDNEETKHERLDKLQEELFGNETDVGDALAHKEGVGYTTSNLKVN